MAGEFGTVDSAPPVGENIHADAPFDPWGEGPADNQSSTLGTESAVGSAAPSKEPQGDYDYGDPALEELERQEAAARNQPTEPEDDDEPEGGARVTGKDGQPVGDTFRTEQLIRAGRLGFSPEEMADFGSARALETALRREERLHASVQQQRQQQVQPPPNPFAHFANHQNLVQAAAAGLKPKLDRQDLLNRGFDEGMIDAMATMLEANAKQAVEAIAQQMAPLAANAAALHNFTVQLTQNVTRNEQIRAERERLAGIEKWNGEFEKQVDALPEEWQGIVGKGSNKQELHTMCGVIAQSYQGVGKPVPEAKKLVQQALQMTFGNRVQSVVREQVRKDVDRRQQRGIARARSGGSQVPQSGEQKAIAFWNNAVSGRARRN